LELVGGGVDYLFDVVAEVFYWMIADWILPDTSAMKV
jgi:hypothetical protein